MKTPSVQPARVEANTEVRTYNLTQVYDESIKKLAFFGYFFLVLKLQRKPPDQPSHVTCAAGMSGQSSGPRN